ncbi:MAG: TRAP transporter substrate-binding protein DctP [Chloroflexi bacterium]|nr:TRAP transporter substrate-binding protein DctP [Chloroflexota bacterium]
MKKRVSLILAAILVLLLVPILAACTQQAPAQPPVTVTVTATPAAGAPPATAPVTAPPAAAKYKWKFFSNYTLKEFPHRQIPALIQQVNAATNGALQIELFALGEHPFASKDVLKAISERKAEMVGLTAGHVQGTEPAMGTYVLPMFMPGDLESYVKLWQATRNQTTQKIFDRWDAKIALGYLWPQQNFIADVPVTSWDALKGKKVRASSKEANDVVNVLGGTGITLAWAEAPTALGTKVIDGVGTSTGSMYDAGLAQWAKYVTLINMHYHDAYWLVNSKALAELDPATRDAFLKVYKDAEPRITEGQMSDAAMKMEKLVTEFGVTITAPTSKFRNEVVEKVKAEVWPGYVKASGPDAQAFLDVVSAKGKELGIPGF